MMWVLAVAYTACIVGVLGLCRAAAIGDRQLHAQPDDLERLYAEPDRYCPACGTWLAGDALFDSPECQAWFWEHDDA